MIQGPLSSVSCEKPKVTFAIIAFNQRDFIAEAVESALSQTYSPLEIIVSDDASPDGSFEICQELVRAYSGEHEIRLNRNETNLGLIPHVNRVLGLARGDLVIMAAGDDISSPQRAEQLVAEWIRQGCPAGLASAAVLVDSSRNELGLVGACPQLSRSSSKSEQLLAFQHQPTLSLLGCTAAWSRATWEVFGPLPEDCYNEDNILTLRGILLGGVGLVDRPLVSYRVHATNIWNGRVATLPIDIEDISKTEAAILRKCRMHRLSLQGSIRDVDKARAEDLISGEEHTKLVHALQLEIRRLELRENWWQLSVRDKVRRIRFLKEDVRTRYSMLLPQPAHFRVMSLRHRFKRLRESRRTHSEQACG
jgi:glycosyltransferase involved in cell wall biosynthesis